MAEKRVCLERVKSDEGGKLSHSDVKRGVKSRGTVPA